MTTEELEQQATACADMARLADTLICALHKRGYTRAEAVTLTAGIMSRHVSNNPTFVLAAEGLPVEGSMH